MEQLHKNKKDTSWQWFKHNNNKQTKKKQGTAQGSVFLQTDF